VRVVEDILSLAEELKGPTIEAVLAKSGCRHLLSGGY
jgi:hypothetical protein